MLDKDSLRKVRFPAQAEDGPMSINGWLLEWVVLEGSIYGIIEDDFGKCHHCQVSEIKFIDRED